jgi:hypothetical protein
MCGVHIPWRERGTSLEPSKRKIDETKEREGKTIKG